MFYLTEIMARIHCGIFHKFSQCLTIYTRPAKDYLFDDYAKAFPAGSPQIIKFSIQHDCLTNEKLLTLNICVGI